MSAPRDIQREVHFGFLPSLRRDRHFSLMDFVLVQTGFGIAAWCFLVGGITGTMLEGRHALWVILMGNAIPVLLILPVALFLARAGLDTFIGSVAALGHRGSQAFFAIFATLNLGWITIALFMLGESAIKLSDHAGLPGFLTTRTTGAPIYAIVFFAIAVAVAYSGPVAIKWFTRIGVPAILLILLGLIIVVVGKYGFARVFESAPVEPTEDFRYGIMLALELNVGLGFSWLPYFGQWVRLARSESGAPSPHSWLARSILPTG
jgi:nucleobase:cation symporter-1, NCS1 family